MMCFDCFRLSYPNKLVFSDDPVDWHFRWGEPQLPTSTLHFKCILRFIHVPNPLFEKQNRGFLRNLDLRWYSMLDMLARLNVWRYSRLYKKNQTGRWFQPKGGKTPILTDMFLECFGSTTKWEPPLRVPTFAKSKGIQDGLLFPTR